MTFVLVSGKAGAGKSTFGKHLVTALTRRGLQCRQVELGALLKEITFELLRLFNIPIDSIDDLYNEHKCRYRTYLQRIGTECFRKVFGDDVWCELLMMKLERMNVMDDVIVITDVRFASERRYFESLGNETITVRVECEHPRMTMTDAEREHVSETESDGWEYDSVFVNTMDERIEKDVERWAMKWIDGEEKEVDEVDDEEMRMLSEGADELIKGLEEMVSEMEEVLMDEEMTAHDDTVEVDPSHITSEVDRNDDTNDDTTHVDTVEVDRNDDTTHVDMVEVDRNDDTTHVDTVEVDCHDDTTHVGTVKVDRNDDTVPVTPHVNRNDAPHVDMKDVTATPSRPSNTITLTSPSTSSSIIVNPSSTASIALGQIGEQHIIDIITSIRPSFDISHVSSTGHLADIHVRDLDHNILYVVEVKLKQVITREDVAKFNRDLSTIKSTSTEHVIGIFASINSQRIPSIGTIRVDMTTIYLTQTYINTSTFDVLFRMVETYYIPLVTASMLTSKRKDYVIPSKVVELLVRLRTEYDTLTIDVETMTVMQRNTEQTLQNIHGLIGRMQLKRQFIQFITNEFADVMPAMRTEMSRRVEDDLREYIRAHRNVRKKDLLREFPSMKTELGSMRLNDIVAHYG